MSTATGQPSRTRLAPSGQGAGSLWSSGST